MLTSDRFVSSFECPGLFTGLCIDMWCLINMWCLAHKWAIEALVFTLYIWQLCCLKSFLCKASVMSQGEVAKQSWRKKPTFKKERRVRWVWGWVEGRWRGQHSANILKGSYFHGSLIRSSITRCPRPLILLRPLTPNLIIDKTIQINYLLGLLFIDKSFGQMISNNHKWIRACQ